MPVVNAQPAARPANAEELRDAIAAASARKQSIELTGNGSKRLMAGPVAPADVRITTAGMRRILLYEPRDLTISVEAGLPFAELNAELARNGQMIPLDGPFNDQATVGGVVAANISGARRRLYGTARDLVIGMKFATMDGKLVDTGGMVVKNVAGLDMGKLMIGSFGTLAGIASVNFKLTPRPQASRTLLFAFEDLKAAMAARDAAIRGVLNPVAVELLNPVLSAQLMLKSYTLALLFSGNDAVMERSVREAGAFGAGRVLTVEDEQRFWHALYDVTPKFLEKFADGAVVRLSTSITECAAALESVDGPGHVHAASGVVRGWFSRPESAMRCMADAGRQGWKAVVEFSTETAKNGLTLWPEPGDDFSIMKRVKHMFDPDNLLNRGRLFGRI